MRSRLHRGHPALPQHGSTSPGRPSAQQAELKRDQLLLGTGIGMSTAAAAGSFIDVFAKNAARNNHDRNATYRWALRERQYLQPRYTAFSAIENAVGAERVLQESTTAGAFIKNAQRSAVATTVSNPASQLESMRQQLTRLNQIIQTNRVPPSPLARLGHALNRVPPRLGQGAQGALVLGSLATMAPVFGKLLLQDGRSASSQFA